MTEALHQLGFGFSLAIQPANIAYAVVGSLLGTLIGVLPGLGPATTIAVLLPVTYQVASPLGALIMLCAIYYGAMYGGSTTSILLRVPGEAASVVTCIDGYEMAKQGRAGPALAISAIGSFIAGTLGVVGLTVAGPAIAKYALTFGPPEFFALATFGLAIASTLTAGPPVTGICMAIIGVLIGLVGVDTVTGVDRFSFGSIQLANGIELVPLLMGLLGLAEICVSLERTGAVTLITKKIGRLMPTRDDWRESAMPIGRGTIIGFMFGLVPGSGAMIPPFISYAVEKWLSRTPERFGRGAIAGVASPESANNSASSGAFIPLLTLGLPSSPVMGVLFAALLIQNIQPGPLLLVQHADIFWGVIASMYVGNVILLVLNLPLVGLWVQILRVPLWILGPAVLVVSVTGAYSMRNSWFDVGVLIASTAFGYLFHKAGLEPSPFVMGFILADVLDTSLRQAMLMGDGSPLILISRPASGIVLAAALVVVATQLIMFARGTFLGAAVSGSEAS